MSMNKRPEKEFTAEIAEKAEQVWKTIEGYLPREEGYGKKVIEAMNYSITSGGKRLRPLIMRESFLMLSEIRDDGKDFPEEELLGAFMAAMEMIHTSSLVHDDLPAMDNDEYRRGRKTTHAVYGAGMATLAGDGLLNLAYETIGGVLRKYVSRDSTLALRGVEALDILSSKVGIYGMIGGQSADLESEGQSDIHADKLLYIHENKTSALIEASLMCGAILAGADMRAISDMEKAGRFAGLAFQIRDDILDIEGDAEKLGKPLHSDEKNGKCTYISLYGMDRAKADCQDYSEEAATLISRYAGSDGFLTRLILHLTQRDS